MKLYSRKDFLNEGKFDKLFGVKPHVGNLNLTDKRIFEFVDLPYEVTGDFTCNSNPLDSLEGCPQIIGGDFICNLNNNLITLEGGPIQVGGNYYAFGNSLKNLVGAPETIYGLFKCSYNHLESLEGAPKEINGLFDCTGNAKITKEMLQELRKTSRITGVIYSSLGEF